MHPGCEKACLSAAALRKHSKGHAFAASKAAALPASAYRKPDRCTPCEKLRDQRLTRGEDKVAAIGVKRVLEHETADAKANALRSKKKKKLVEQGSKVFGSLDDILFQNKVRKRLGEELPAALRNFELDGVGAVVGEGSVAHSALMEHLAECFVAHEAEIARLNKCVRKLKKENASLKAGEHVEAAVKESSGGGDDFAGRVAATNIAPAFF